MMPTFINIINTIISGSESKKKPLMCLIAGSLEYVRCHLFKEQFPYFYMVMDVPKRYA